MVKWLMSNPNLTAAVIATNNFNQLLYNVAAARACTLGFDDRRNLDLLAGTTRG